VVAGGGFVVTELRHAEPFVELRLFNNVAFTMASLVVFLNTITFMASSFVVTLFLQIHLLYTPLQAAWILMPSAVVIGILSVVTGRLSDLVSPKVLIIFGLATSIPLIIAGSALLMALLDRYPILVWAGAGLLGWVAGDIMIKDTALLTWFDAALIDKLHYWAAAAGAVFVVGVGWLLRRVHHKRALEGPLIVDTPQMEFPAHQPAEKSRSKDKL